MKKLCVAAGLFALAASVSVPSRAQDLRAVSINGIWNPVVGTGGAYHIKNSNGRESDMEFAVVGKESTGGAEGYWIEMTMADPHGQGEIVVKSLLLFSNSNTLVHKTIVQMPGRPPMEMSDIMAAHAPGGSHFQDVHVDAQNVGSESVTVPAGTFTCDHWHGKDGDAWIAKDISPYGLVKASSKEGMLMVLTKVIKDAKDKITGTPQPFNPMMMRQQAPPQ
ncbi:MAG: hypothetical protein ACRD50_13695 [Candidatus Acidiferrales bacterium]